MKVGDKFICIKDVKYDGKYIFHTNQNCCVSDIFSYSVYMIPEYIKIGSSVGGLWLNLGEHIFSNDFDEHFDTNKNIRRMKLDKIDDR